MLASIPLTNSIKSNHKKNFLSTLGQLKRFYERQEEVLNYFNP